MVVKISASVPDELWGEAQARSRLDSPSAIVQEALRRAYSTPAGPNVDSAVAGRSSQARVAAIRDRLKQQVQELWERGYAAGLDLAEALSWEALQHYGSYERSDLNEWITGPLPEEDADLVRIHLDDTGYASGPMPTAYYQGFDHALADVWEAVTEAGGTDGGQMSDAFSLLAARTPTPATDDDVPF